MILVISCSHHPESRSRLLAKAAQQSLHNLHAPVDFLDLRTVDLPLCDGHASYDHPSSMKAKALVEKASGILIAMPIYNYGTNAITKNFIEHTGKAWQRKPVGMLCAAGGKGSYMALIPLAGSLMLDFHCHVLPRHVYATSDQFENDQITDSGVQERIDLMAGDILWLAEAVAARKHREIV
ncbi:MAG: NAD(P)H-dependent oxidoreductase [Chthoniobacterales bacterium]|nr:NAD(P)H-dependent oxidoreductase [Chthoniobacterales bacterium]